MGIGLTLVPVTVAAMSGVEPRRSGVASALINTSQQVGGALGLAVLASLAASHTHHLATTRASLTSGFQVAAAIAAVAAAVAAALVPRPDNRPDVRQVIVSRLRREPDTDRP